VKPSPWAAVFIGCGCLLLAASAWLALAGFSRVAPTGPVEPPVAAQPAA
jgi:hypothetical protein